MRARYPVPVRMDSLPPDELLSPHQIQDRVAKDCKTRENRQSPAVTSSRNTGRAPSHSLNTKVHERFGRQMSAPASFVGGACFGFPDKALACIAAQRDSPYQCVLLEHQQLPQPVQGRPRVHADRVICVCVHVWEFLRCAGAPQVADYLRRIRKGHSKDDGVLGEQGAVLVQVLQMLDGRHQGEFLSIYCTATAMPFRRAYFWHTFVDSLLLIPITDAHKRTHVYLYVCIDRCTHAHIHTYISIHKYIYIYMYIYVSICKCAYVYTYICIYICIYIYFFYMYIYIHVYIYVYI